MNTLKLNEHSFSSVKQFCRGVLTNPQLKVRMLAQSFDSNRDSLEALIDKVNKILLINNIDSLVIQQGALSTLFTSPLSKKLKHIKVAVFYEVITAKGCSHFVQVGCSIDSIGSAK